MLGDRAGKRLRVNDGIAIPVLDALSESVSTRTRSRLPSHEARPTVVESRKSKARKGKKTDQAVPFDSSKENSVSASPVVPVPVPTAIAPQLATRSAGRPCKRTTTAPGELLRAYIAKGSRSSSLSARDAQNADASTNPGPKKARGRKRARAEFEETAHSEHPVQPAITLPRPILRVPPMKNSTGRRTVADNALSAPQPQLPISLVAMDGMIRDIASIAQHELIPSAHVESAWEHNPDNPDPGDSAIGEPLSKVASHGPQTLSQDSSDEEPLSKVTSKRVHYRSQALGEEEALSRATSKSLDDCSRKSTQRSVNLSYELLDNATVPSPVLQTDETHSTSLFTALTACPLLDTLSMQSPIVKLPLREYPPIWSQVCLMIRSLDHPYAEFFYFIFDSLGRKSASPSTGSAATRAACTSLRTS